MNLIMPNIHLESMVNAHGKLYGVTLEMVPHATQVSLQELFHTPGKIVPRVRAIKNSLWDEPLFLGGRTHKTQDGNLETLQSTWKHWGEWLAAPRSPIRLGQKASTTSSYLMSMQHADHPDTVLVVQVNRLSTEEREKSKKKKQIPDATIAQIQISFVHMSKRFRNAETVFQSLPGISLDMMVKPFADEAFYTRADAAFDIFTFLEGEKDTRNFSTQTRALHSQLYTADPISSRRGNETGKLPEFNLTPVQYIQPMHTVDYANIGKVFNDLRKTITLFDGIW